MSNIGFTLVLHLEANDESERALDRNRCCSQQQSAKIDVSPNVGDSGEAERLFRREAERCCTKPLRGTPTSLNRR